MHRNTFILVVFLAVVASLLVGFNVGKQFHQEPAIAVPTKTPTAAPTHPQLPLRPYTNTSCSVSLAYPETYQVTESTRSAIFRSDMDAIVLACQQDIPDIAVSEDNKERVQIGTVSGMLYHTASPKDGTAIDVLKITHPKTGMDILISGIGSSFTAIITSLTLIP